jgi:hypothetical protein
VMFVAAGLVVAVLLISWLMTHPQADYQHVGQVVVGSR